MPVTIEIESIATVVGGHTVPADDFQGGVESVIRLDERFPLETLAGLAEFSHLEVVWWFSKASPSDVALHARSPRNNPAWPRTGTFAHRNHRRPNQLAVSHPQLLGVDGRDLRVTHLDAVDGTPVFDISPYFPVMGPQGEIRVPTWVSEMLDGYWAPADQRPGE
ncbi:SAM-dependent methyltransferase [Actinacidiphila sp. DG2A-62]|uniref:SAM-dependent methyltransferase n=1 Tax=Actinacidiphila sp. DG2A-62 TaxID=3108821 RepID=UPI002DC0283C|nr:SAM-dependent methyltransferase [Actinacidiphila sp. DG2A-62]MEC3996088.1 SAM-dependent methyltransferase [Actinacidiphila sp. DG2A-62]